MKRGILLAIAAAMVAFCACQAGDGPSGSSISNAAEGSAAAQAAPDGGGSTQGGPAQQAAADATIRAVVGKNCNYVYHMLAVSGCGYQNDYGEAHRPLHDAADLQTLKDHERYLTVAGGEYQGELYFLCVVLPASLDDDVSAETYYEALADLFGAGATEQNFEKYREIYEASFSSVAEVNLKSFREFYRANGALKEEIAAIAGVLHRNYKIYSDQVWEKTRAELSAVASEINGELAKADIVSRWEEALGCPYGRGDFLAMLCNSMENGPNCINLNDQKDVFYPSGDAPSAVRLISHEFGIYLLMDELAGTMAFEGYSHYELTEALAEYYNTLVSGGHTDWDWGAEIIDYYRQLQESEPEITARELFLRASAHFLPDASGAAPAA